MGPRAGLVERRKGNSLKMVVFWDVESCSLVDIDRRSIITLMMEAVSSSETSGYIYQTTQCNISKTAISILIAVRT
jgi:hypothetical protein